MSDPIERTPISQAALSLVLTARECRADVDEVLAAWHGYLVTLSRPFEILLVDDGSSDGTPERALVLGEQYPELKVLRHEQPRGLGAALKTGIDAARQPLVVTAPCDKQFEPSGLYRILEAIDQVDFVTGYRVGPRLPFLQRLWDDWRRLLARLFLGASLEPRTSWPGLSGWRRRWAARWLFGVRVQDPECPFRLYRREVFDKIPLQCAGSAVLIEILAKANHRECLMAEVPVFWMPPPRSAVHAHADVTASAELRRLFFKPEFT